MVRESRNPVNSFLTVETFLLFSPRTIAFVEIDHKDTKTPPKQAKIGNRVYAVTDDEGRYHTGRYQLSKGSWDGWHIASNGARLRPVVISDPYDRYRHGSNLSLWKEKREAYLTLVGLTTDQVAAVIDKESK